MTRRRVIQHILSSAMYVRCQFPVFPMAKTGNKPGYVQWEISIERIVYYGINSVQGFMV